MTQLNSSFPKWAPTLLVELIRATPEQIGQNNRLKNLLSESRTLCSTSSQDAECSWAEWIKQLKPTLAEDLMLRMIFHSPRKDQWEGWFTTTQEQLDESNIQLNEKLVIASKLCSNPDMESAWSIMTRYSREPAFEIAVLYAVHRARQMSHQTFREPPINSVLG